MSNIASERVRAKMSQKDVAEKMSTSVSTVSRWERDQQYPSGQQIVELCNLFKCSADYLLGMSNERNFSHT